mmetsp:Transcript_12308/g.26192  ORF Transcript_12308/g.26192 Transcript_12308/m.26192 type:complete len:567 (+) Transcript_12308:899-2599(+)
MPYNSRQGERNDLFTKINTKNNADEAATPVGCTLSTASKANNEIDVVNSSNDNMNTEMNYKTNTKGTKDDSEMPKCCGFLTASMADDESSVVHGLSCKRKNKTKTNIYTKGIKDDYRTQKCCGFLTASTAEDDSSVVHGSSEFDDVEQESDEWESYSSQSDLSSLHSNWSDTDDECNHIEESTSNTHSQCGVELTGSMTKSGGIVGIMSDFSDSTMLTTPSVGSRQMFVIEETNDIACINVSGRHHLKKEGPVTFLECTQLARFPQSCAGIVCAFQVKTKKWKLGAIQNLFPLNNRPIVRVFCWVGALHLPSVPLFATIHRSSWQDIESHFSLQNYFLLDIEIVFINQIRGTSIRMEPICSTTTNVIDGGVQCSRVGPDLFSPMVPTSWNTGSNECFDFASVRLVNLYDVDDLPTTFVRNKYSCKHAGWKKNRACRKADAPAIVRKWIGVSSWVPKKNLVGSFFVVTNHDNSPLVKDQLVHLDPTLEDKFLLPSLSSFNDTSILTQSFHAMTKAQRQAVVAIFADGVDVEEFEPTIRHILKDHRQPVFISDDKINISIKNNSNFNG